MSQLSFLVCVQFWGFGGCFVLGCHGVFLEWGGEGFVVCFFSAMKRSWIESEWLLQQPLRTETYRGKYTQVFSSRPRM